MGARSQLRLLIADASTNRAHELDSILRDAAIRTRPEFCTDLDTASSIVREERLDLMLCDANFDELEARLPQLRKQQPELPIILVESQCDAARLSHGMALGASDVVFENDRERLLYVIKREMHHIHQRHCLRETQHALEEAERRCRLLLANSSIATAYVHEGMHIHANDDYLALFGFEGLDDLLGLPLLDLIDSESTGELKAHMKAFRNGAEEASFSFSGRTVTGEPIMGELTMAPAEYEGEPCTQVLVRPQAAAWNGGTSVQEQPRGAAESGIEALAKRLAEESDATSLTALLIVSIDDFDEIQARYGLQVAHRLTDKVEHCLRGVVSGSTVVRISEQLFAVALHSASDAGNDMDAERIRSAVAEHAFEIGEGTLRVTVTIGALAPSAPTPPLTALELAFRSMAQGRSAGEHNRVYWYQAEEAASGSQPASGGDQKQSAASAEKQRMLDRINEAIDNDRFLLLFQPIISLRSDSEEHYEVFLRMLDDNEGQITPDQFLQIAVEHSVAVKIDRWVILQSIKMLSAHRTKGHDTRLTVNLTSNSLHDTEFAQWLSVAIKAARLPSDAIIFQFTEPDAARYIRESAVFVEGLRSLHCRTSMSHFAKTETAFDTLGRLNVDFVKLDGALVRNVDADRTRRAKLTETLRKLQGLGKLTVIPMVESATELAVLWQAGANYIQGRYLQEPTTDMNYDFTSDD